MRVTSRIHPASVAALASVAVLLIGDAPRGVALGYGPALPILAICGASLFARTRRGPLARAALALLLLLPAVGLRVWNERVLMLDTEHLEAVRAITDTLRLSAGACTGLDTLLVGAAAAGAVIGSGPVPALVVVGGAVGSRLARTSLVHAEHAWIAGDLVGAARWVGVTSLIGWVAALAALGLAMRWRPGPGLPGWLAVALVTGWLATPPVRAALNALPVPHSELALPTAEPGPTVPLPALDPHSESFIADVRVGDHLVRERLAWDCVPPRLRPWGEVARPTVSLAMPGSAGLADLDAALVPLLHHSICQIALPARAPRGRGPLARLLAWPVVVLKLDRPPVGTRWGAIDDAGIRWTQGGESDICGLVPTAPLTIATLWAEAHSALSGGCAHVVLVPAPWRSVDDLDDLSCPGPAAARPSG